MNLLNIVLSTAIQFVPFALLLTLLFRFNLRLSPWLSILIALGMFILSVATNMPLAPRSDGVVQWRFAYSFLFLLILISACVGAIKASPFKTVFALLVIKSYLDDVSLFARLIAVFLYPSVADLPVSALVIGQFLVLTVTLPLVLLFLRKFLRPLIQQDTALSFWRYLWLIPGCYYFIFHIAIYPSYWASSSLSNLNPPALAVIWTAGTFLSYFVIFKMLREVYNNSELQERLHQLDLQTALQKEQYKSLQQTVERTRRSRHDLRQNLLALNGYAKSRDYNRLEDYLGSLLETTGQSEEVICENAAVDAVVRHYVNTALKEGVQFSSTVHLPLELPMLESDFCVLLGNLLENAVEACLRQRNGRRFIQLAVEHSEQGMITIALNNSYEGVLRKRGNAFVSSKRNGQGIGIPSVQNITQKYNGITKFEYAHGVFHSYVLLSPIVRK